MHKLIAGVVGVVLLAPVVSFAYTDCRDVSGDWSGCSVAGLLEISNQTFLSTGDRVAALQELVKRLVAQIAQVKAAQPGTAACFVPTYDLIIGSTDAKTNGEVSKLQQWLKDTGYFPDAQVTGYYGEKTAAAVVKWQKAHGMDFVTLTSGVGKQTRAKMQEACGQVRIKAGWETYQGEGFEFKYPKDLLALYPITQSIYSENPKYTGKKLILQSSVAKLGKVECPDGGKGETIVCSVAGADGIAFLVAEDSVTNVIAPLEKSLLSTATLGGVNVTTFEHGAEGDGARMYFVPLGAQRTLIVYQRYSCCLAELSLSKGLVEQILATVKFSTASGQMPQVTATPTSGSSPLQVTFKFKNLEEKGSYILDTGDERGPQFWVKNGVPCVSGASASLCSEELTHTYYAGSGPGNGNTFKVGLLKYDDVTKAYSIQVPIGDTTITVK